MPRRKAAIKREVLPDPLYGSDQVAKFINVVMRAGKKSIAEKIVYNALTMLTERLKKEHKEDGDDKGGKGGKEQQCFSTLQGSCVHEDVLEVSVNH